MYILSILKSKRKTDAEFVGIKLHPFSSVEKVNSRQDLKYLQLRDPGSSPG